MSNRNGRPIKIGYSLCLLEGCMDGRTPQWADIMAMARRVEELGFDSIWLTDHMLLTLEGSVIGTWEAGSTLAALAATTNKVELGTAVICTAFRNPALLAKMADNIDEISGGRLVLGLGAGWHDPEYHAFGYPTDKRYSKFEEAIQIIHGLLRNGSIDFEGTYYQARECELQPRGPRPGGPPILIGTTGKKMLRLTARYADQWNAVSFEKPPGQSRPEALKGEMAILDDACKNLGRDASTLERTAMVSWRPTDQRDDWIGTPFFGEPLTGSPEEVAEVFREFARAGFSHLQVSILPNYSLAAVEAFAPVLEALDNSN